MYFNFGWYFNVSGWFWVVFGEGNFDGNKCFLNTKTFALKYLRYSLNGNTNFVVLPFLFILINIIGIFIIITILKLL